MRLMVGRKRGTGLNEKYKIGLYSRVSRKKQAQEKTSESQISAILEYVELKSEKVDPDLYFIDNGVSGDSLERPGLDKLRDNALDGEVLNYTEDFVIEEKVKMGTSSGPRSVIYLIFVPKVQFFPL